MKRECRKNRAKARLKIGQLGFWGGSHPSQTLPPSFRWSDLYCSLASEKPGTWISKALLPTPSPKVPALRLLELGVALRVAQLVKRALPGRGVPPCRNLPRGRRAKGSEATRAICSPDTATHRSLLSRLPEAPFSTRVTFPVRKVKSWVRWCGAYEGCPRKGGLGITSWEGPRDTPPPPVRSLGCQRR